jgi:hypothetical protein
MGYCGATEEPVTLTKQMKIGLCEQGQGELANRQLLPPESSWRSNRAGCRKIVGTVEQYPDEDAARRSVVGLVSELNTDGRPTNSGTMIVAQLCDHFEQRELAKENTWRSHATKKIYKAYLTRWIRPHWKKYQLAEVRTIQVESWLRGLPLAKSSCAKIRNLIESPAEGAVSGTRAVNSTTDSGLLAQARLRDRSRNCAPFFTRGRNRRGSLFLPASRLRGVALAKKLVRTQSPLP